MDTDCRMNGGGGGGGSVEVAAEAVAAPTAESITTSATKTQTTQHHHKALDNNAAIESDDSERWEDFFGSSTDISPSVIDYYDRLSSNIEHLHLIQNPETLKQIQPDDNPTTTTSLSTTNPVLQHVDHLTSTTTTRSHQRTITKHALDRPVKPQPQVSPKKTFTVLSQNVQRMLAHSSCESVDRLDDSASPVDEKLSNPATEATMAANRSSPVKAHKHSHHTQLPLSKNMCKLTQAGTEMVDAYESALEFNSSTESLNKTASNTCSGYFGSDTVTDSEKTPTNFDGNESFRYDGDREESQSNRSTLTDASQLIPTDRDVQASNGNTEPETISQTIIESESSDELFEDCINEAINFMVNVPDSLQARKVASLQKLCTIKERKRMLFHNTVIEDGVHMEADTETKTNGMGRPERKLSPPSVLVVPNIDRLKHRPLSASSISSTTSSSSSGSEHLASKLSVSYLASIESLADHSENELANGSFTLCERACMEIIDSERSYVEDLGQVIKGYLEDWKERACLNINQLQILFSNIQEVYDFNSVLLKQLINSGTDPVKIAKCFLSQRNKFEAYTVYCTSYAEAISLLTTLLQASHTNALLTSTQKMLRHRLPLGSYLLKPVQRILKYHLLLDNLRKHCESNEVVTQAHVLMKEVGRNIDQVKKNREQLSRVKELSGILDGWLGPELTVLGDLKLEGQLMENNKQRVVLLFQTMLIITKKKEDNRLQFKTYISGSHLMLIEHLPGEPTSFNVIPYNDPHPTQIKLTARTRDQKRQWAQHIKQVMLEHFDIPSRAKELVFKLGDEEDRTPDKNSWKWTNNTSTTPEYLERRNQYRRSEMRYRSSKKLRKPLTSSVSLEGFHNHKTPTPPRKLSALASSDGLSVDDSALLTATTPPSTHFKATCDHWGTDCKCDRVKLQLSSALAAKSDARSRSEPRIPDAFVNKHNVDADTVSMKNIDSRTRDRLIGASNEIKMYNTKTLPKRIANLKKQRAKTAAKETFKFYMDFPATDETTVLRITESTENLAVKESKDKEPAGDIKETESSVVADELNDVTPAKTMDDVSIISDLLKDKHLEFDRILKKPPKKKSFDNGKLPGGRDSFLSKPDVDARVVEASSPSTNQDKLSPEILPSEPIYESLLRNVHVPYKFSPILSRSISHQHYRFQQQNSASKNSIEEPDGEDKSPEGDGETFDGPEEDYVTLEYNETGQLKSVDGFNVAGKRRINEVAMMRNSDTNINYDQMSGPDGKRLATQSSKRGTLNRQTSLCVMSTSTPNPFDSPPDSVNQSNTSLSSLQQPHLKHRLSLDQINRSKIDRLPNRRVSDVSEMRQQRIIHKQGSESLGSRIAHLDYADPRTLFNSGSQGNILINRQSIRNSQPLNSSAVSLASSSDSVPDLLNKTSLSFCPIGDSFYERSVEDLLENNNNDSKDSVVFRDSAIYSGDDTKPDHIYETPLHLVIPVDKSMKPAIPAKPLQSPPPLPAKMSREASRISIGGNVTQNQSWVHKQIKNFDN